MADMARICHSIKYNGAKKESLRVTADMAIIIHCHIHNCPNRDVIYQNNIHRGLLFNGKSGDGLMLKCKVVTV